MIFMVQSAVSFNKKLEKKKRKEKKRAHFL